MALIAVTSLLSFAGIIFFIIWKRTQTKIGLYKGLASKLNFSFKNEKSILTSNPNVYGIKSGFRILIFDEVISSGRKSDRSSSTYTRIVFDNSPFNYNFSIEAEYLFSGTGKKDIQFNIPELDNKFILKSENEVKFKEIMISNLIKELLRIENDLLGEIKNENGNLIYSFSSEVFNQKKMNKLESVLNFMILLAERASNP